MGLDIIAVIDNSLSMGLTNLAQFQALLATIVNPLTLCSSSKNCLRIGLVTFTSTATMVADLNAFNDTIMFDETLFSISIANNNEVNILSGLQMANTIFMNNVVSNTSRSVMLFTSAYNDTQSERLVSLALEMREDDIKILTVAVVGNMGSDEIKKVGELAWPGFDFVNDDIGHFS
uniref:VWFA domain-containing protein n=1 Tax=Panagrolaimus davidi TaxID=227884 RepID=A0A914QUR4_9BILA